MFGHFFTHSRRRARHGEGFYGALLSVLRGNGIAARTLGVAALATHGFTGAHTQTPARSRKSALPAAY
jgi:hypothetical protein